MTRSKSPRTWAAAVAVACLIAVAVAAASAHGERTTPHGSAKVTLQTFRGVWGGHTRRLSISRGGIAKESIDDGCCQHVFSAHYKLSNPRGSSARPIVTATVTWAQVPDPSVFTKAFPAPRVGQRTTFTIKHTSQADILTVSARKATYCRNLVGSASPCGA